MTGQMKVKCDATDRRTNLMAYYKVMLSFLNSQRCKGFLIVDTCPILPVDICLSLTVDTVRL